MRLLLLRPVLRLFGLVFLLFVVWQFFIFFRERPRAFTHAETRAAQEAAQSIVKELQRKVDQPTRFGVAYFVGDRYNMVTDTLRTTLSAPAGWTVEEGSIIIRFLEDVGQAIARATSLEEVIQAGQQVELDVIVAGRVLSAETVNDTGRVQIETHIYDLRSGAWLARTTFTGQWEPGRIERAGQQVQAVGPFWRFIMWLAVVLILPWVTAFATHYALERRSNAISFVVITGYTVLDMALALLLVGFTLAGGLPWFKFLVAFLFSAGYNYWACERIAGRAGR